MMSVTVTTVAGGKNIRLRGCPPPAGEPVPGKGAERILDGIIGGRRAEEQEPWSAPTAANAVNVPAGWQLSL